MNNIKIEGHLNYILYPKKFTLNKNIFCILKVNNYIVKGIVLSYLEINDYIIAEGYLNDDCIDKAIIEISLPRDSQKIYGRLYEIFKDLTIVDHLNTIPNIWTVLEQHQLDNFSSEGKVKEIYKIFDNYYKKRFSEEQILFDFINKNNIKLNTTQVQNLLNTYVKADDIIYIIQNKLINLLEIESIGAKTVINIANSLNYSFDQKLELEIIVNLYECYDNAGDSCMYYDDLIVFLEKKYKKENIIEKIEILLNEEKIVKFNNFLYIKILYDCEKNISKNLIKIKKLPSPLLIHEEEAKKYFIDSNFNEKQFDGIMGLFRNNVNIITGQAGTGKSYILTNLIKFIAGFKHIGCLFLSPTGKACDRLNKDKNFKQYKVKSYTVHKFIKYSFGKTPAIEEIDNILTTNIKIFIIDEFSMVGLELLNLFIQKIKNLKNVILLFLGDKNQLPSISCGDNLNQLIRSKCFKVTVLDEVKRSTNEALTKAQNDLLNFIVPDNLYNDNSFQWIKLDPDINNSILFDVILKYKKLPLILSSTNKLIEINQDLVKKTYNKSINPKESLKQIKDEKIKKYVDRTIYLLDNNKDEEEIQSNINKINLHLIKNDLEEIDYKPTSIIINKVEYNINDKIIITNNNYTTELMNGMMGTIKNIVDNNEERYIEVLFDGLEYEYKKISQDDLNNIRLAYLITIHKSQGSESDVIIVLLNKSRLNNINLLYTAITRSKDQCILIASEDTIKDIIENKKFVKRLSNLRLFCQKYLNT